MGILHIQFSMNNFLVSDLNAQRTEMNSATAKMGRPCNSNCGKRRFHFIVVGIAERKKPLGRRRRYDDTIRRDFREVTAARNLQVS